MEIVLEYLAKGFMVMLSISMPCVLIAAAVGLVVGILQAVTSIQEQTIAAAPKIVLVFLSIIILGGYFMKILTNYVKEGVHVALEVVPRNDIYVLPRDYFKYTHPFSAEMQDKINTSSKSPAFKNQGAIPWDSKATKHSIYVKSSQSAADGPNFLEKLKIQNNR